MDDTTAPAPTAEEVQPSTEAPIQTGATEGTGASGQAAETDEQKRASEAGRELAARRRSSQAAAQFRREFEEMKRERAELTRALIEATRGQRQPEARPVDEAPKREAFDSFEEWNRADARYWARKEAQETLRTQLSELSEQAQQHQFRQMAQQVEQAHEQRIAEHAGKSADFEALVEERGAHISVPDEVGHLIKLMPDGPQVIDAMLRYPQLAQQFWSMPRHEQLLSLGKISHALQTRPPQVSKAPPPGKPVGSGGSAGYAGMTQDQYYAEVTKHHRRGRT